MKRKKKIKGQETKRKNLRKETIRKINYVFQTLENTDVNQNERTFLAKFGHIFAQKNCKFNFSNITVSVSHTFLVQL
jgi:hypothetical protein